MRRPALHRPHPATGWSHPYAPTPHVFYADGGTEPAENTGAPQAPAPSPADMPRPQSSKPPKPRTDPNLPDGEFAVTQAWLDQRFAGEKDSGRRAGGQALASDLGFDDVNGLRQFITEQRQAQEAQLSEAERRERELAAEKKQVEQERAAIAADKRLLTRERALSRLGAADTEDSPNLQYALALLEQELRDQPDADPATIAEAAEKVKGRLPNLFGATQHSAPAPSAAPPAPTGLPSGGMPRPGASQPKPGERGLEMLRRRGKVRSDA
ncbi:hypothetical protein [Streptomyces sp. Ac-502]|uniref:hypothetical protein n=1 Tax=Streptomyces sp. Ac-502 TaxID=3342801 RepID=UPI003862C348